MSLANRIQRIRQQLDLSPAPQVLGRLKRMIGLTWEAEGCRLATGQRCAVSTLDGGEVEAEVMGFSGDRIFLMPYETGRPVTPGAAVRPLTQSQIPVGHGLLGRVVDGLGRPLDGQGPLREVDHASFAANPINPLQRAPITQPLDVGVQAINALLTVGQGQRIGLFAGAGVGKSRLLGMMTRYTSADIIVVGLVGERGREVHEFITEILGPEGLARAVVVAAPADDSPVLRLRAAMTSTRIAEYFRDCGARVLLLMDSLTRFAQAQREIALAIGEPPATRGYPPSVFAKIPQLVERAGNGRADEGGSITAFYTVLTEGDDPQDPVADSARAILDGHILLSRDLADSGHYPAIDVESSVSRVMNAIIQPDHWQRALLFRQLCAAYSRSRELIAIGAYQKGADPMTDRAIALYPELMGFLQQGFDEAAHYPSSLAALEALPLQQEAPEAVRRAEPVAVGGV